MAAKRNVSLLISLSFAVTRVEFKISWRGRGDAGRFEKGRRGDGEYDFRDDFVPLLLLTRSN
jgi:hypothetical protein